MRKSIVSLVVFISVLLAACSGGSKVPSPTSVLPDAEARMTQAASFTTLYQFTTFINLDGNYGLTVLGGALYGLNGTPDSSQCPHFSGCPIAFRLAPSGRVKTVLMFQTGGHEGVPRSELTPWDGWLYGAAWTNVYQHPRAMVYRIDASGNEHVIARLPSGEFPSSAVTVLDGAIYGVTATGGRSRRGVVYEIDPSGSVHTVYEFKGGNDTANPTYVTAYRGVLYGIAGGRSHTSCGCSSIFSVTPSGRERVVYRFPQRPGGKEVPMTPLTFDDAGNIYGAMNPGGIGECAAPSPACGAIFELAASGTPRLRGLYQFTGGKDGMSPNGGLIRDSSGRIFGTTAWGGNVSTSWPMGYGTIFELTPSGSTYAKTILHAFNKTDGADPSTAMVRFGNAFYGTTSEGGNSANECKQGGSQYVAGCGTIFKIVP